MTVHIDFPYKLYLVISEAACEGRNFLEVATMAVRGGVDIIQLREKQLSAAAFLTKAKQLKEVTDAYNIPLIINDNLEVAMQVNAAGIHVGNSDSSPEQVRHTWKDDQKMIGYSIEQLSQLNNTRAAFAGHFGISPVFNTATKTDTIIEWGLEGITTIREQTNKPLVAIGNMHLSNVRSVINAGADCIAVVSAICAAPNPGKAAYDLKNELLK